MMDVQYLYDCDELRNEQYWNDHLDYLQGKRDMFWEQHNQIIRMRREDLQVGDVILFKHRFHELCEGDPLLKPSRHSQGYYRFDLVGGTRHEQFLLTPEALASWNGHCWHWKG